MLCLDFALKRPTTSGTTFTWTSTAAVVRVSWRVAAVQGGRRVIIGGCEDNEELVAGRCR